MSPELAPKLPPKLSPELIPKLPPELISLRGFYSPSLLSENKLRHVLHQWANWRMDQLAPKLAPELVRELAPALARGMAPGLVPGLHVNWGRSGARIGV